MKKRNLSYQEKSGFKVPQDYFENLEETLMRKISPENTTVESYKGSPGFVVPEDYFQQMEVQVLQKIEKDQEQGKVISIVARKTLYYAAAVAAVVVILLSTNLFNSTVPEYTIDSVEMSALEDYIDKGYMDFTFDEISAYITEEGNPMQNFNASTLSDEEVFTYLSEDIEDPGLLIE